MCCSFRLLNPVALHDLAVTVDTDIPRAARLGLTVEHGGVCNVVVLKHTLLELTLWSEVLLQINMRGGKGAQAHSLSNITREKNRRRTETF